MTSTDTGRCRIVSTVCATHCGGACLLKVHVEDGRITRVETDDGREPQLRACLRGRALRQRVYAPDRVLYPLRRKGDRGTGQFERISWDEALATVAAELKRARETHGPEAILLVTGAGDCASLHTAGTMARLLAMAGGFTNKYGATSYEGAMFAASVTYGTVVCCSTRDDLLHSRLIILWGWDPATTISGTNTPWFLARAKEQGTRIVAVDPYLNDSAAAFGDQWLAIRPGTDTAMLIAMAHVLIAEGLEDRRFLDTYTTGVDTFRNYVLGREDGEPKTPEWAEAVTGVPAHAIRDLARQYATLRPAALMAGIAPGRTAFGEQFHRAAITLAAMTGNVGVHGGDSGAMAWGATKGGYPFCRGNPTGIPAFENPVEDRSSGPATAAQGGVYPQVHYTRVADAILEGKGGGYPADYKVLFVANTNYLNMLPDTNKVVRAVRKLDFVVVLEQFMTATAKYADIVLPTAYFVERDDIALGNGMPYIGFQRKAVEPAGECKPHNEIAKELAAHLGVSGYDDRASEDALRDVARRLQIPDYEGFKEAGVHWIERTEPYVAFQNQIEDPANNPFPTPSGKIEIYSQRLADLKNPLLPPIPKYIETWESPNDPLAAKYPLQIVNNHSKRRANAQFDTVPWLRDAIPDAILLNAGDARARGIRDGDLVRVFNDRGEMRIPAKVTERLMPGVAVLPAGAWYSPDENGVDRGGCANLLTRDEPSPAGAFAYNTALVEVAKAR